MQQDVAEEIALKALGWIAGDDELLGIFLGATGASASDMRSRIADPDFLFSVLEFLTMDDSWIMGFCDSAGLAYEVPMQARLVLPGGAPVHWT
jgi:hypothetical protein